MEFAEFVKTLTDMELVALQKEARQSQDTETVNLVLIELGKRQQQKDQNENDLIRNLESDETQNILTSIVKLYLEKNLPSDITVRSVKYRITVDGEYKLVSDRPEWLPPFPSKNVFQECITLELVTVGKQTVFAGYGAESRTLIIGEEIENGN